MNTIITIGRQFGSGGHEIGRLLAHTLNIPCYDKELIILAAQKAGMSPEIFSHVDETATSSFLYAVTMGNYPGTAYQPQHGLPLNDKLFIAQTEIIRGKAKEGACVFVGRCADYILRDNPNLFSVFITADLDFRVKRAIEEYGVNADKAVSIVQKHDKARRRHYNYYTGSDWGARANYHMVLNTSKLGIGAATDILKDMIRLAQT